MPSFSDDMKKHLLEWAAAGNVDFDKLETRHGKLSWVLKEEYKRSNLFDEDWWKYIEGKEHRWARALNSSQCFAVNLFAPLAEEPLLAGSVLRQIVPELPLGKYDEIAISFEYTPTGAPNWLGESGHPTQVDVAFEVRNRNNLKAVLLVEVKFTEAEFGSCRGFAPPTGERPGNHDRTRCLTLAKIIENPARNCWLVEHAGRTYWDHLMKDDSSLSPSRLAEGEPCPFRGGLYQIMRNAVLADEFRRRADLNWAGFALCVHPGNDAVWSLDEPVEGRTDVRDAASFLLNGKPLHLIEPRQIVDATLRASPNYVGWAEYTKTRYRI